jgi:large subunit ribosomal protein L18
MAKIKDPRRARRARVKRGIRKKVYGTPTRPRLTVYRSNLHTYAQLIDDTRGHTVASMSTLQADVEGEEHMDRSFNVGKRLAEKALKAGFEKAVFDRNGYQYHGLVKAVAEGAREGGLDL